jgi:hypothetical protein
MAPSACQQPALLALGTDDRVSTGSKAGLPARPRGILSGVVRTETAAIPPPTLDLMSAVASDEVREKAFDWLCDSATASARRDGRGWPGPRWNASSRRRPGWPRSKRRGTAQRGTCRLACRRWSKRSWRQRRHPAQDRRDRERKGRRPHPKSLVLRGAALVVLRTGVIPGLMSKRHRPTLGVPEDSKGWPVAVGITFGAGVGGSRVGWRARRVHRSG